MIDKLYIIAGTNEQYVNFVRKKVTENWPNDTSTSMSNFVYVRDREQLMGVRDPRGYFIGTWYDNPHIPGILDWLTVSTTDLQKIHEFNKIYDIYREHQKSKVL
jgi:hypothetical protein